MTWLGGRLSSTQVEHLSMEVAEQKNVSSVQFPR
jgi:hypothetical protein